ncbi:hypothetical protein MRB53_010452 [Persea americana]|uniref:Uncharacterized protein n=1 Tax=Persea americana TaxID=3435 RepID=A0ACC2LS73_PERAE|nr:hypothetical protein MRB53_010452 [Persea americana]
MGEEAKEEEKKLEEEKKEEDNGEKKEEEKKEEKKEEVPEEIVLKVDMHCEACARKVERSLKGFEGVDDVKTDCRARMVVVKGKTADPVKVCERIQKKSGRKVEIISPLPKPPEEGKKDDDTNQKEGKKDEPAVVTVMLNVRMHCEACAQVLQKQIRKMNGVESVVTDMMNHRVIVKGIIDPTNLVEKVYRKTKKQASIVKDEEKKEEEKKEDKGEKEGEGKEEDEKKANAKKLEYWPLAYYTDYAYAPQIFSDENPNACTIM